MPGDDSTAAADTLPEFIFGPLSTAAGRVRQARLQCTGLRHDVNRVVLAPDPGEAVVIRVQVGPELAVTAVELRYSIDPGLDPAADGSSADRAPAEGVRCLAMTRSRLRWDDLAWGYLEEWTASIPGQPTGTAVSYAITATTSDGDRLGCPFLDQERLRRSVLAPEELDLDALSRRPPEPGPRTYAYVVGRRPIPDWLREAVIYQIFVDRFAPDPGTCFRDPGDLAGFFGGSLRGVIARLDHLQALGVTCLWLTPIFPSPSHHGYDPVDPGAVEPRLGTLADWDALVAAARARGMRLLLDYVVNHVSSEHPRFRAAQADAADPAGAWFRFREHPHDYDCFFDVPGQPELRSDHPEVRAYFLEHARFWLTRGCDGFRLDYAANVSHAFWSLFREGTRATRADAVTLGEITQPPDVMRSYTGRMDGCLDFRLLELLRGFFAHRSLSASAFEHALEQHLSYFGADLVLPSFLDNHDMNRFLWVVGGDRRRLRLAALCQFTLPQPPILYYGTEVGLSQRAGVGRLEEARLPMLWGEDQDADLLAFFQELIAFRHAHPALRSEPRQAWLLDDSRGLLGVRCGAVAVVMNNAEQPATVEFPTAWGGAEPVLLTAPAEPIAAVAGTLTLAPWAGAALRLSPGSPSPPAAGPPVPSVDHPADG
jgi:cyclomaltodextrinase